MREEWRWCLILLSFAHCDSMQPSSLFPTTSLHDSGTLIVVTVPHLPDIQNWPHIDRICTGYRDEKRWSMLLLGNKRRQCRFAPTSGICVKCLIFNIFLHFHINLYEDVMCVPISFDIKSTFLKSLFRKRCVKLWPLPVLERVDHTLYPVDLTY